jgi:predicted NUDIX family NTP pyrophosphohydrolase
MKFTQLIEDKMAKHVYSAGLLMTHAGKVFLVKAAVCKKANWGIPKGHIEKGEDPLDAAKREFQEETGITPPSDNSLYTKLTTVTSKGGKTVYSWQFEGTGEEVFNPPKEHYMTITVKGKTLSMPECDKGQYMELENASRVIMEYQLPLLTSYKQLT